MILVVILNKYCKFQVASGGNLSDPQKSALSFPSLAAAAKRSVSFQSGGEGAWGVVVVVEAIR
jgi:hypothetical protein